MVDAIGASGGGVEIVFWAFDDLWVETLALKDIQGVHVVKIHSRCDVFTCGI